MMDIAIIEVESYNQIHSFCFVYENFKDGVWSTKLVDGSRTVIARFECTSIRESFELAATRILQIGNVRKIGSTHKNYDSYPGLLFHYFTKLRSKEKETWIDCTV